MAITNLENESSIAVQDSVNDAAELITRMGRKAKEASAVLCLAPTEQKNAALHEAAKALHDDIDLLKEANVVELNESNATGDTGANIDRMRIDDLRI